MPARAASRSTASTKSRCSISRTNVMASPLLLQPKQYQNPMSGFTENDGVFSLWKGHNPTKRLPTRFSARCSPTRPTMSVASRTRATSSSTMPTADRDYGVGSDAAWQIVGTPPEEIDSEREREAIRHAAHVVHREGRGLSRPRRGRHHLAVAHRRQAARRVSEVVDKASE